MFNATRMRDIKYPVITGDFSVNLESVVYTGWDIST